MPSFSVLFCLAVRFDRFCILNDFDVNWLGMGNQKYLKLLNKRDSHVSLHKKWINLFTLQFHLCFGLGNIDIVQFNVSMLYKRHIAYDPIDNILMNTLKFS